MITIASALVPNGCDVIASLPKASTPPILDTPYSHFQVSGLGGREPAAGFQVRVQVQELILPGARTCT